MSRIRRRVVVHGVVQGVGFREHVRRAAEGRGVAGWVRNRSDGGVETLLEGEREDVERVVDRVRGGPHGAYVARVSETDESPEGLRGFLVEP